MDEAIKQIEKSNIDLEPEVLDAHAVRELLSRYAKAKKLVSYGETMLAAKLDDTAAVARATGSSLGKAKAAVDTGNSLKGADHVREAFKSGEISLDQASEIAKAEQASPGSSTKLLKVAQEDSFQALREKSRKVVLEAEQHRDLASRQHDARRARSYKDDLGMIAINLLLEPHVGVPIVKPSQRPGACSVRPRGTATKSPSSATSQTPTPACSPLQGARPRLASPSWWCWSRTRSQSGVGRRFKRARCARSQGSVPSLSRAPERSPQTPF